MATRNQYRYIKFFEEVRSSDVNIVGGKNASLGELLSFGIPVPLGFAVTANAFDYVLESNDILYDGKLISLKEYIKHQIENISDEIQKEDIKSINTVDKICANIRTHIEQAKMPDSLRDEIVDAYRKIISRIGNDTTFAVRSSATAEDLPDASFAGQQDTHLNISGEEEIVDYILKDMASVFTTRATLYRERAGFDHFSVKLSVGVQEMAGGREGVTASGVMFTEDPDSGNPNVIIIRGTWGLGELIVQGVEKGDEFIVFKHSPGGMRIINRTLTKKLQMMEFDEEKGGTITISVPEDQQREFCLTDNQVLQLAEYAKKIREHYRKRMDIEWALAGNKIYIVQARPETVHSQKGDKEEIFYLIEDPQKLKQEGLFIRNTGTAIGRRIGYGALKIIESINEAHLLKDGDILVTEETNPDWTSYMQNLGGVITERGGPTCHAAIVSRELNIAGIVGADNIVEKLKERRREQQLDSLTIDCSEGEARIWAKEVEYDFDTIEFSQLPKTNTQVLVNLGIPKGALSAGKYPDGTGLARLEFIINDEIQIHPNALINYDRLLVRHEILLERRKEIERVKKSDLHENDPFNKEIRRLRETLDRVEELTFHYDDKEEFYIEKLAEGIATVAAGVWKELPDGSMAPCIVRLSDFKTNEYANLLGGWIYEGNEANPMMGFRGCSRYVHEDFQEAFILELKAIKRAREWGLTNIIPMLPFTRSPQEAEKIIDIMKSQGLVRGEKGLKIFCMAEIPSNIICADLFCEYFDGFSIGSNDLTQLTYGVGRDNEKLIPLADNFGYNANSEALKRAISQLIHTAHEYGKKVGICGQAPSDYPDFLRFLVQEGIDSISLNFDTYAKGRINTWRTEIIENKLRDQNREKAYTFLAECDDFIERIRVPRGRIRNLIRKKRKKAPQKLKETAEKYNQIFADIQSIAYEFVRKVNKNPENFESLYTEYKTQLDQFRETIPSLKKTIREFGIF
jgi:pyruvate,water dikinase